MLKRGNDVLSFIESIRMEDRYVNKWEETRAQQNRMRHQLAEDQLRNRINDAKNNIDLENRAHSEIERYLEESREVAIK